MGWNMKANSGGGNFEACPAGNHPAVLIALIDLGTQSEVFQGTPREARKVYLCWEIPDEKIESGRSHVIGREYTMSFHEKAGFRHLVEAWRGKPFADGEEFDPSKLLGQSCLLNVIQEESGSGKTFAQVKGVSAMPKGMPKPAATLKTVCFNIDDDGPAKFPKDEWLPFSYGKSLVSKASMSPEWIAAGGQRTQPAASQQKASPPAGYGSSRRETVPEEEEPAPF